MVELSPEILEELDSFSPEAKAKVMKRLEEKNAEERRIFYCKRGRTCDGKPHEGVPYNHARSDQWPPSPLDPNWQTWALVGGRGCIAPWSRIELADGSTERVDVLAERGDSVQVKTLYGSAWTDGAPFAKGEADLFLVTLEDGSTSTVTDQHRFLTADGWRRLSQLRVGQPLAVSARAPQGIPADGQSELREGAHRSSRTAGDSRLGCPTYLRFGGRRPQMAEGSDRASSQRAGDAVGRSLPSLLPDALESGSAGSRAYPLSRRQSRMHSWWGAPSRVAGVSPFAPSPSGQPPHRGRSLLQSLLSSSPASPESEAARRRNLRALGTPPPHASDRMSASGLRMQITAAALSSETTQRALRSPLPSPRLRTDDASLLIPLVASWSAISSIEFSHRGVYYDLTVPDGEHYMADGVWAHNSGKTRSGAEFIRVMSKNVGRIALIGATSADVRDTMIEGDSGLIKVCEMAGEKCEYYPSKRRVVFANGAKAGVFSGEEPDRLRGPQHGLAWLDEPAHYPLIDDVWDMLLLGLRLGTAPKIALTTTPLPIKWLKDRLADARTRISRVSTYANLDNLAATFADQVLSRYEGTRLGKQELHGEILEDVEGALWSPQLFHESTMSSEMLGRIVVAIDPAGTSNRRSDETGIIAAGRYGNGLTAHAHVLADRSGRYSPSGWSHAAVNLYRELRADAIVVESNFGGDMVKSTIENTGFEGRIIVKRAMKSKALRAEPVVGLYEQGRVHHAPGLVDLEEEQLTWVPGQGDSPNRVDALVWAIEDLIDSRGPASVGRAKGSVPRTGLQPRAAQRRPTLTIFGRQR